ncbi:unnamed protein product, partial [Brassica rapa subsp. trilocularis]
IVSYTWHCQESLHSRAQDFKHEQKWGGEKDDSQHRVQRDLQLPATISQYVIYYLQLSV